MFIKKLLIASLVAGSLSSVALPSMSQGAMARTAPPPPRAERAPQPRRGYVWAPGHWDLRGQRYQWIKGSWVRARPGYTYQTARWEERNGRWYQRPGAWVRGGRDNDGDGVRNRNDGDRDGDGVVNRRDSNPNNPRRN
jgi:hypothetical protein